MEPQPFSTSPSPSFPPSDASGETGKVTPSGVWYVVGGLLAGVGIVVGVAMIISSIVSYADRVDNFDRVDIPGSSTVQLDGTGGYSVYFEHRFVEDRFGDPPIDVEIMAPDGSEVDLEEYGSEVTYTSGSHNGRALYSFQVDEPGAYQVTVSGDSGGRVAVGRGLGRGLAGGIVGGIAIGFVSVVAGLVIVIVVGLKRGNSKRRLRPLTPPPPPPGWGYPPPGAMPPPPPAPPAAPPPTPSAG